MRKNITTQCKNCRLSLQLSLTLTSGCPKYEIEKGNEISWFAKIRYKVVGFGIVLAVHTIGKVQV
jgi:hypothetical protein